MLGAVRLGVPDSRRTLAIYVAAGASFAALSARGLTVPLYAHELGADRFQVGALVSAGSQLAMAATTSVFPLYVWQIVGGLGAGAQQAALFSAITALVPSNRL